VLGDLQFTGSLVLKTRIREMSKNRAGRGKRFVTMADVQRGDDSLAQCRLDSVIYLFAVRPEFHCTRVRHRSPKEPFRFDIQYCQCGEESSLHVEYTPQDLHFMVSAHKCRGHFVVGRMAPRDARAASWLVTNADVRVDETSRAMHPLRVMA
jgi:hypothetical protein